MREWNEYWKHFRIIDLADLIPVTGLVPKPGLIQVQKCLWVQDMLPALDDTSSNHSTLFTPLALDGSTCP